MKKNNMFIYKTSFLLYFLLFSLSWLIFWNRQNPYIRPIAYFIILSIMGVIILIQVFESSNKKYYRVLIFLEIFLLSISFNITQLLLYQTVTGRDPWRHWILTETIIRTGQIPPFEKLPTPYVATPNFHLLIATYMLISKMTYKWALYLVAGIGTLLLELLIIYLLARLLFNEKISFLAMLFVAVFDIVLYMTGRNIIPNTTGVGVIILLLYLFAILHERLHPKDEVLVVILVLGLVFMHTLSYATALAQLIILVILDFVLNGDKELGKENLRRLLTFFILGVFVWAFVSGIYFKVGIELVWKSLMGLNKSIESYAQRLAVPVSYIIIGRLGMLTLFGISSIGILRVLLSQDRRSSKVTKLGISAAFFIVIGLVAPFIPTTVHEIGERWWYYGGILGGIYAGYLVFQVWYSKAFMSLKRFLVVLSTFALIFLMFTSSMSNDDNPLVPQYTLRTGWYDSEISATKFAVTKSLLPIATDVDFQHFPSVRVGMLKEGFKAFPICNLKTFDAIVQSNNCLALIRVKLIQDRYFVLGKGYSQRAYLPLGAETKRILSRILVSKNTVYNTGSVVVAF